MMQSTGSVVWKDALREAEAEEKRRRHWRQWTLRGTSFVREREGLLAAAAVVSMVRSPKRNGGEALDRLWRCVGCPQLEINGPGDGAPVLAPAHPLNSKAYESLQFRLRVTSYLSLHYCVPVIALLPRSRMSSSLQCLFAASTPS